MSQSNFWNTAKTCRRKDRFLATCIRQLTDGYVKVFKLPPSTGP